MSGRALEVVVFELSQGVTAEEFLETTGAVSEWAATQPGFISRDLTRTPDGSKWIDVIWWESLENAQQAAQAAGSSAACAPMFSKIDFGSVTMLHGLPQVLQAA